MDDVTELADRWGIETSYFDVQGGYHEADDEIVRRVAAALATSGHQPCRFPEPPPQSAYQGDGRRCWVLAVQLYGVRSRGNWGHGDFSDLASLLELVAALGGAGVGLNPLHALFYDRPGGGSPYSPNSRLFLNPLYIDVEAIEEFKTGDVSELSEEIERLRAAELIDYEAVATVKLGALRAAHRAFLRGGTEKRRQDFEAYRRQRGPDLERFAAFETLRGLFANVWPEWPPDWRQPDNLAQLRARHPDEICFHEFMQWNAERQLERCRDIARERAFSIGLYLDTAVGVDPQGADAWMDTKSVLNGLSVGAPPDQYNPAGQGWGIVTYNPHALAESNFDAFRRLLQSAMRNAGAIRIDHVLGLMRLFVIPDGLKPNAGVYIRYPFAALLDVVAEESRRYRCITIGEDLGTVPENFRAKLSAAGVWSYLVMLFERNDDGSFRAPADYPERAVASFNTHDLPTFSGWIRGHDLGVKRAIGVDPGESDAEREHARSALRAAVGADAAVTFEQAVAFLATTPTRLVSVSIEDVLGIADQVNMPGTVDQHPNWRRRWLLTLEELASDQRLRRIAATFARAGRAGAAAS